MSDFTFTNETSVHAIMKQLHESGESIVFRCYSDDTLERQLRYRLSSVTIDDDDVRFSRGILYSDEEVHCPSLTGCTTSLSPLRDMRVCINNKELTDRVTTAKCLLYFFPGMAARLIRSRGITLESVIVAWWRGKLDVDSNCRDLQSISTETVIWDTWKAFYCLFFGDFLDKNTSVKHAVVRGNITTSGSCPSCFDLIFESAFKNESTSFGSKLTTPRLQTLCLVISDGYLQPEIIENLLFLLENHRIAHRLIIYIVNATIDQRHLMRFLRLKGLHFAKIQGSSTEIESSRREINEICVSNTSLCGGTILYGTQRLGLLCKRNREIQLFHRIVELVVTFYQFDVPAYVLVEILDCLYEFCFYDAALKVCLAQRAIVACRNKIK